MSLLQKFKAYLNEDDEEYDALVEQEQLAKEERRKKRQEAKVMRDQERATKAAEKNRMASMQELRKEVKETVSSNSERKTVGDFCEQLVDVSYHLADMRREYALVTDYLVDIQRIEELPINIAEEIMETAGRLVKLDGSRQTYLKSENLLSMEQYNKIERLEKEVPDTIKNLNQMEMRDSMLKSDMGYLEGEKEDLKYIRIEETENAYRIRSALFGVLIVFFLVSVALLIIALATKANVMLPAAIEAAVAVICFVVCYLNYKEISRRVKETDAKIKRAVSLLNKVKAKFVNNTNTLDYIYEKYGVNSCKQLEFVWEQYNQMQRDAKRYSQASDEYRRVSDLLVNRLADVGISDPLVWPKQTGALLDRREMVEIKHGLNVRRQKLREKMASGEKIQENARNALHAAIDSNPGIEGYIKELLASYNLSL